MYDIIQIHTYPHIYCGYFIQTRWPMIRDRENSGGSSPYMYTTLTLDYKFIS